MLPIFIFFLMYLADTIFSNMERVFFKPSSPAKKTADTTTKEEVKPKARNPEIEKQEQVINDLVLKISTMKHDSEKFNTPSTYAQYSKMQRQIIKLEDQLDQERNKLKELLKNENQDSASNKTNETQTQNQVSQDEQKKTESNKRAAKKLNGYFKWIFTASRYAFAPIVVLIFRSTSYRMNFDSSKFYPLSGLLGEQGHTHLDLYFSVVWFFICFRVVSRIKMIRAAKVIKP